MLSVEYQIEGNEKVARNLVSAALSLPDESLVRLYKAIRNFDDGERE
jgi:hypothetical protein